MKKLNKILAWMSFVLLFLLVFNILYVNLLPMEYDFIILVCVFLYLCIFGYFSFKKNKSDITSVILSILLVVSIFFNISGLIYYYISYNAVNNISSVDYETVYYSIYGKDESVNKIGVVEGISDEVLSFVRNDYNVEIKYYNDYALLVDDYKDGLISNILMNDSYTSLYDIDKTYLIKTYEIKTYLDLESSVDVLNDTVNIYLSGIDSNRDVSSRTRSDVNIVMSINVKTKDILLIHIPRDYYVNIPSLGYDKINHAGVIGLNESILVIEELLDEKIDYYVKVNFNTIVELVDSIGGINVHSDYSFSNIKVGNNYLNGKETLNFVRKRKSLPGGDRQRGKNQQEVISSIIEKVSSSEVLLVNYLDIVNAISSLVQTNMSSEDIFAIVNSQLSDMSVYTISNYNLDGFDTHEYSSLLGFDEWMMIGDEESIKEGRILLDNINKKGE